LTESVIRSVRPQSGDCPSSRPITICLLGASFQTGNLGVSALASGSIRAALNADPESRVFFFDYGAEPAIWEEQYQGTSVSIELINIRFNKKIYLANNIARLILTALCMRLVPARFRSQAEFESNKSLRNIVQADIIAAISGGDSFSDIYGLARFVYVALPQILVLLLGKPLVLLPQTFGPFKSALARAIARYILRRAKMIHSRDLDGLEAVRKLLGGYCARLDFCYDMGFVLEPHIREERIPGWLAKRKKGTPLLGLNISGLLYMGGYTRDNMFRLKADYRQLILGLIDYFVRTLGADIMLVPHVLGAAEGSESDVIACREAYRGASVESRRNLHLLESDYDQHEMKALIGHCDFFLGSRMHACIAALSQCVPAVGLAYSRKFQGVFESIGMEELVVDLREYGNELVVEFAARAYKRRAELRSSLEVKMPVVLGQVLDLFKEPSA